MKKGKAVDGETENEKWGKGRFARNLAPRGSESTGFTGEWTEYVHSIYFVQGLLYIDVQII